MLLMVSLLSLLNVVVVDVRVVVIDVVVLLGFIVVVLINTHVYIMMRHACP